MAFLSANTVVAVAVQTAKDVPATINALTDHLPVANLRPSNNVFTVNDPTYTGDIHRRGDIPTGRDVSLSFDMPIRPPGGTAPPAAGTYVAGRIYRAAGFQETVQATPLLAATALGGAGTTSTIVMPSAASTVNEFYTGLPVLLPGVGAGVAGLGMIRKYVGSTKTATLMRTLAAAPTGNVAIPAFLAYSLLKSAPEVYLTLEYWLHQKKYRAVNVTASSLTQNYNVATRGGEVPSDAVTVTGDVEEINPEVDEVAPTVPYQPTPPVFTNGEAYLMGKGVCGSSYVANMGITIGYPPCQNGKNGHDAPQITGTQRSVTLNVQETLNATFNFNDVATQHMNGAIDPIGFYLRYGQVSGKTVQFGVPNGRLGFSAADPSGEFVTRTPELYIDEALRCFNRVFPYF